MPRRRKYTSLDVIYLIIGVVFFGAIYVVISVTNWLHNSLGIPSEIARYAAIAFVVSIPIAIAVLFYFKNERERKLKIEWEKYVEDMQERKFKGIQIANVDSMTGIEFEQYLQRLLTNQGYDVGMTAASGDLGVDLIASRDGDKIAVQAKRYSTNVSRRAISDAVAGMYHYGCNKAMVITNSYFSPGAVILAEATECILIDRDTLAKWVNEFQITENKTVPNTACT